MSPQLSELSIDRKAIEEYLRRYEDQTLKAIESHSNAFGQTLLAAYLLFLFPDRVLEKHMDVLDPTLLPLFLMLALYTYMTYNMKILGSLIKDVTKNADRIRYLHESSGTGNSAFFKLIHLNSSRIKLASPLGPLQWASICMARKIAISLDQWTFWLWGTAGVVVLCLILAFLLFPLVGLLWKLPKWGLIACLLPSYYGARLCFRFPRSLIYLIRGNIEARAAHFGVRDGLIRMYERLYSWFNREDDDKQEMDHQN